MDNTYSTGWPLASPDLSGLAVPTHEHIRHRLIRSTSSSTWPLNEVDQVKAAEILCELGCETTAQALLQLASMKAGPEHRRVGANVFYSEDALLKFASTIERVVPVADDTADDPQIE